MSDELRMLNSLTNIEQQNEMIIQNLQILNQNLDVIIEEIRSFHEHFIQSNPISLRHAFK